ncbi:MAG: Ig-like domain-containing protein, partial [Pseudohongiella sp.]|nr:Ig-like domain-containing protein [Pseudohongiella sp.]
VDGSVWTAGSGSSVTLQQDNDYTVLVRQIDLAGNMSSNSSLSFMLDTKAPDAPTVSLANDTNNGSDNITSSGIVNVSGLESGALWQRSIDGSDWVDGSGSSFSVEAEGKNVVYVRQTDLAGNVSEAQSLSFELDTTVAIPTIVLNDTGSSSSDRITNDGLIGVTGIEENATWQYSINAGSTWTSGSGSSISFSSSSKYDLLVRQTDLAGNTSETASLNFTLDKSSPAFFQQAHRLVNDTGTSSTDKITNNGLMVISSGMEAGGTLQFSIDGGSTWQDGTINSSATNSGNFALTQEGLNSVIIRQMDLAGNIGSKSKAVTINLDTTAPDALMPSLAKDSNHGSDGITNDGILNIAGLESAASWQYSLNGSTWTAGSGSSVKFQDNGDYTVQVRQTDLAGNVSSNSSLSFMLDTQAPEALTVSLVTDTNVLSDGITRDGKVNVGNFESGATWEYSIDGSTWTDGSGSTITVTDDGSYDLQVRQMDVAGNVSVAGSLSFTLDTAAPSAPSLTLASDTNNGSDSITSDGTINVAGLESDAVWQYKFDGGSVWTDGVDSSVSVEGDGVVAIHVRQLDLAGNVSNTSGLSFTLDTAAPSAPSLSLASDTNLGSDSITSNGTINIAGLESDATWQYSLDGSTWSNGSGSSVSVEGDGAKTVQVRQMDLAGNVSASGSLSFTLDTA